MNISQQEQNALFTSKLIEGKDEDTANSEILRDLKFIKEFNQLKRAQINELKDLERTKAKLLKEIGKLRQNLLKLQQTPIRSISNQKNYVCLDTDGNLATTRDLWRIIGYLESKGKTNLSDINKTCLLKNRCHSALGFLLRTNLIKQSFEIKRGVKVTYFER